ncbi:MAG: ShlB/FhaC/HecB family hemolysin secretion/activation protein [Rhizorhabdus sp.]
MGAQSATGSNELVRIRLRSKGVTQALRCIVGAVIMTVLLPCALVQAQPAAPAGQVSLEGIPTVDRDRLDRKDPALPRQAPIVPPAPKPATAQASATPAPTVPLKRVRFQGSTIDPQRLAAAASVFAGAPLNSATLQKLANAITAVYAKSDIAFYAVSIPAQPMGDGVITIQVVEGRIARYSLAKTTSSTPTRLIDAQLAPLLADKPTHTPRLERTLSLLRDIPGQKLKADLRRTAKPDELELALDVDRKQVEVTLNVNNRGVVNVTTGVQAQLGIALNGILREGDSTRFSATVPFQPSRYQFYSGSHTTPLGADGTTLSLSGAYVRTRTREPEVRGEAKQFGVVVAHPLVRSYKRNLSLNLSLDGTNSENYFLDTAFGGFRTRTLRVGASWSVVSKTDGYAVSTSISQGLDGLGATPSIGYSEATYRKANLQLIALKQVTKKVSAKVGIRGQFTQDRLPTTERFALGGEGAGLAFRYGVLTADKAASADVELSWRLLGKDSASRGVTAFVYADGAVGRSFARPTYGLRTADYKLASAGGGFRVNPIAGWSATAQLAVPVKTPFSGFSRKAHFFFSVSRTV